MRRAIGAIACVATLALLIAASVPAYADPGDGNGNGTPPGQAGGNDKDKGNNGENGKADKGNNGENGKADKDNNGNGGAGNDGAPNGANGTVKIHEWPDHKNSSDMANDPKVCQFEIHGFKFDPAESEDWWVQAHKWGNGDESKAVLTGDYAANSSGDWTEGPFTLADGHYKLFVEMSHGTFKHKVFKVDCPPVSGSEGENEEGVDNENEQGDTEESDNEQNNVGGQQQNNAVAGFEQSPTTGGTAHLVEFETQGAQAGAQAGTQVAGQQSAPAAVAGIQSLPATSTDR